MNVCGAGVTGLQRSRRTCAIAIAGAVLLVQPRVRKGTSHLHRLVEILSLRAFSGLCIVFSATCQMTELLVAAAKYVYIAYRLVA